MSCIVNNICGLRIHPWQPEIRNKHNPNRVLVRLESSALQLPVERLGLPIMRPLRRTAGDASGSQPRLPIGVPIKLRGHADGGEIFQR